MLNLVLTIIFIGNLITTSYRSVPECTDDSPFITSNGERVSPHGVAVSRDLHERWGGPLKYGDLLYIEGNGFKIVNDVMAARFKQRLDIWVPTYDAEKVFDKKFKSKKLRVWMIKNR